MTTQRAALYIRQSQTHDGTISPAIQEKNVRAFIASQDGWAATEVYSDIDISGLKEENRPRFLDLKRDYAAGKFDIAVADEFTRFSRNAVDGIALLGTMKIATAKEGIPPEDDFMPSLYFLLSAKFSKDMGKRWKEGLTHRIRKGVQPSGNAQFGYTRHHPGPDGKPITKDNPKAKGVIEQYLINPEEAAIVREAYSRYTKGEGARTICEDFNARKLAAAGPAGWHAPGFFDLLDKPFYAGKIEWVLDKTKAKSENRKPTVIVVDGAHEPILDAAQWQEYLKKRNERKTQAKPRNAKWMLQGLVVCGLCGGKMVSHMARGVPNLMCATYNAKGKGDDGCKGIFRKRSKVQTAVWWWLGSHLDEWASAMPTDEEGRLAADKAVADAQVNKDAARTKYSNYQKFAFEHGIRPEESKANLDEYSAAIDQAQAVLDDALAEQGSFTPASDIHEQISNGALLMGFSPDRQKMVQLPDGEWEDAAEEISEASTAQFREALSKIIDKVIVHPATGKSPRDPERDHRAEVEVVPR